MALPTWVAAGTFQAALTAVTPGMPAGLATNDILLLIIETRVAEATAIADAGGGTWSAVPDSPIEVASASRLTVFWSRYDGAQTAPTTNDSGNHQSAIIHAFRGCPTSGDPHNVTSSNTDTGANTSVSWTGDTTTEADCLIVLITTINNGSGNLGAVTDAALSNITERSDNGHSQSFGGGIAVVTGEKATAGAYGPSTAIKTNNQFDANLTIALKSANPSAPADDSGSNLGLLGVG